MSLSGRVLTKEITAELDASGLSWLQGEHTDWRCITEYAPTQGYWSPGDGKPAVDLSDPADAQAAGRCVANRTRYVDLFARNGSIHRAPCGWCAYPTDELLTALDHAAWKSRYIATEYLIWPTKGGSYTRTTGRADNYENPAWQAFFRGATSDTEGLPPSELEHARKRRAMAIAEAAGYDVAMEAGQ